MSSVDGKRRRPRRRSLQPDSAAGPIAPSPSPASHLGKRRRRVSDSSAPSQPPPLPAASAARVEEKDEEERELEAFLFAGSIGTASLPFGHEMKMGEEAQDKAESSALPAPLEQSSEDEEQTGVSALFVIDKRGSSRVAAADSAALPAAPAAADDADAASSASSAVWYDPDDLSHRIDVSAQSRLRKLRHSASERLITAADFQRRLRSVYSNLQHPASWTQGKGAVAEQHEPGWDAFVSSRGVRRRTAPSLPSGHLDIQPLRDANSTQPAEGVLHAVQFHPTAPLLLTGGMDCKLRLFSIDGVRNRHAQTVLLPQLPVTHAAFIHSASQIVCTGRRRFFYTVDLHTSQISKVTVPSRSERSWESAVTAADADSLSLLGDDGFISVLDVRSKQWIGGMKGGASVRAGAYSEAGRELWTVGEEEELLVWDMRTRTCRERRSDPASLHNSAIALSPAASSASTPLVAVGNAAGIVSLYPAGPRSASDSPPALRTLTSLTTGVDCLRFNPSGELLVSASRRQRDSLSVYHVRSGSVVANWPTSRTPLHYVTALDFSPHSGFLAVGNDRGRVLLYRIKHFADM